MSLRRAGLFVVAMLCLAACSSNSLSSPARIVGVESLSDGITVETVPAADAPSHYVVVTASANDLWVPATWQHVVWDRKVGDDWVPAFEAPYSFDPGITPRPATDYVDGAFHEADAAILKTIWLSVPPESGVFRAEVGRDEVGKPRYIVVRIGE